LERKVFLVKRLFFNFSDLPFVTTNFLGQRWPSHEALHCFNKRFWCFIELFEAVV
jgi:hypothetical protein